MKRGVLKHLSAVALAGSLFAVGSVALAPAASAVTGICGTYSVYWANNSKCYYNIQSYSRDNMKYTYGNKAGYGKTSDQGVCSPYTNYGVNHNV